MIEIRISSIGVQSLVFEVDDTLISRFLIKDQMSGARECLSEFLATGQMSGRPDWTEQQIQKELLIAIPSLNIEYFLPERQPEESLETVQEEEFILPVSVPVPDSQEMQDPEHQKKTNGPKRWTYRAVLKLISLWQERKERFENNIEKNENIWEDLAAAMASNGLNFTSAQCENKFKYLKRSYMETKDKNRKSTGQPEKTCAFFEELNEIFQKSPLVCPPSLVSSRDGAPSTSRQLSATNDEIPGTTSETERQPALPASEHTEPAKKKTRLESSLTKWAEKFQAESAVRDAARQKRHEETLQVQREANELYKNMMTKLLEKL